MQHYDLENVGKHYETTWMRLPHEQLEAYLKERTDWCFNHAWRHKRCCRAGLMESCRHGNFVVFGWKKGPGKKNGWAEKFLSCDRSVKLVKPKHQDAVVSVEKNWWCFKPQSLGKRIISVFIPCWFLLFILWLSISTIYLYLSTCLLYLSVCLFVSVRRFGKPAFLWQSRRTRLFAQNIAFRAMLPTFHPLYSSLDVPPVWCFFSNVLFYMMKAPPSVIFVPSWKLGFSISVLKLHDSVTCIRHTAIW